MERNPLACFASVMRMLKHFLPRYVLLNVLINMTCIEGIIDSWILLLILENFQVRSKKVELRRGAKVVPISLEQVICIVSFLLSVLFCHGFKFCMYMQGVDWKMIFSRNVL